VATCSMSLCGNMFDAEAEGLHFFSEALCGLMTL